MRKNLKNNLSNKGDLELLKLLTPALSYQELEARIAFDAAAVATAVEAFTDDATADAETAPAAEQQNESSQSTDTLVEALASITDESDTPVEIAFVDSSIEDLDTLLASIDANVEIILLDADRDGVEQIADILSERSDVDAIHILSHGSQAELFLGTANLTLESMSGEYADELSIINQALRETGDILIYGCNFGEGALGKQAAERLAELTGADVAASTDDTGHISLGGDWDLEYQSGVIESSVVVSSEGQQNWSQLLVTEKVRDNFGTVSFSGNDGDVDWSGDWIEVDAGGAGAATGNVIVLGDELRLSGLGSSAAREADLSGATSATFRFDYRTGSGIESGDPDSIVIEVSDDGGASWTTLEDINYLDGANSGSKNYDISAYMSVNTQIRFQVNNGYGGPDEFFYVDNVRIDYVLANTAPVITSNGGGATAGVNAVENQTAVTTVTATDRRSRYADLFDQRWRGRRQIRHR